MLSDVFRVTDIEKFMALFVEWTKNLVLAKTGRSPYRFEIPQSGIMEVSVEIEYKEIGILIELKYTENAAFDERCQKSMNQIKDRNYEEILIDDGMKTIHHMELHATKRAVK